MKIENTHKQILTEVKFNVKLENEKEILLFNKILDFAETYIRSEYRPSIFSKNLTELDMISEFKRTIKI